MADYNKIIEGLKLEAIDMFWERKRYQMLLKDDLIFYLNKYYGTKFDKKNKKEEMVEAMEDLLTTDTLEHFGEHLERFGLTKVDIRDLLHIGKDRLKKIIEEGKIRQIGSYTGSTDRYRIEYHIMSINDAIKYFDESEMWVPYV
jgi:hypothetical protein